MSRTTPEVAARNNKPLLLALVVVSCVAIAEAVVIVVMLAGRSPSPVSPTVAGGTVTKAGGDSAERAPTGAGARGAGEVTGAVKTAAAPAGTVRGKRGERVDSGGFAITVEKINDRPVSDPLSQVGPEQRYLALLVLVENHTGGNVSFYDTSFRMQDSQSFEFKPLAMKLTGPALGWRNLGNRETMRGWVDFIVPKSSKGLELIYTHLAQPIHVELGD